MIDLRYAELNACKDTRRHGGFYRTIRLSDDYDRPMKNALIAEVHDDFDMEPTGEQLDALLNLFTGAPGLLAALENLMDQLNKTRYFRLYHVDSKTGDGSICNHLSFRRSSGGRFPMDGSLREAWGMDDILGDAMEECEEAIKEANGVETKKTLDGGT
jgi:hypothetical protein